MQARIYSDGYGLRVDLGNTGENWPNSRTQQGFAFMSFGSRTKEVAEQFAREQGATEIIHDEGKRSQ
jgi:hypothetical protein